MVPTTPVLKWKAQAHTSYYMVYVSRDANFTNLLEPSNAIPATTNTRYAPALDNRWWTYPDTEAGEALYWHIRPCRKVNNCAPSPVSATGKAQHSFTKTSPKVDGLTSTDPTRSEITFSWNDYFDTNRSSQWAQTGEDRPQSAMLYRIQVDDVESFGTGQALVDERIVDQATYTAFDKLYPEGTLYWRVQAIDSKGDPQNLTNNDGRLSWSETKTFTKSSPRVPLSSPVDGASVPGTVALRWQPQAFAAEYKVEVYKNNDTTFSTANRVFTKNVRTTAYAHNVPLPVSPTPYVWRVQRIDTKGNPGPWSWGGNVDPDGNPVGRFTVGSAILEITSPAPGASQPPNGPVLTWRDFPGAVKYNVEVNSPAGGFVATGQTVATAYALTNNLATGTYPFKITALDATNTVLGSAQSTFAVDARLVATAPPEVQAPAGTGVGATLTSTPPSWNQADVAMTYQWLRDGQPIAGATGTTYVLTVSDFNRTVSLRVTGKKAGFTDGVTVSNAVGATAGGALQATAQPTITGIAEGRQHVDRRARHLVAAGADLQVPVAADRCADPERQLGELPPDPGGRRQGHLRDGAGLQVRFHRRLGGRGGGGHPQDGLHHHRDPVRDPGQARQAGQGRHHHRGSRRHRAGRANQGHGPHEGAQEADPVHRQERQGHGQAAQAQEGQAPHPGQVPRRRDHAGIAVEGDAALRPAVTLQP